MFKEKAKAFNDKIKNLKSERFQANREIKRNKKRIEEAETLIRELTRKNERLDYRISKIDKYNNLQSPGTYNRINSKEKDNFYDDMNEVFRVLSEEAESPAFRHFGEWMLDYYFKNVEQAQELILLLKSIRADGLEEGLRIDTSILDKSPYAKRFKQTDTHIKYLIEMTSGMFSCKVTLVVNKDTSIIDFIY